MSDGNDVRRIRGREAARRYYDLRLLRISIADGLVTAASRGPNPGGATRRRSEFVRIDRRLVGDITHDKPVFIGQSIHARVRG